MRVGCCFYDCVFALCAHHTCHRRFLEQRKEISEKFAAEQDAFLREAREKHASELQLLQDRHQQHIVSLRTDLEARHQADVRELKAAFEREQRALSDTRVAELQAKHAADIQALETRHLSSLDAVESRHLSEVQALRDEHRRALEQLRAELEEQLPQKCSCHHAVSTRELETLQRECDGELQSTKGCLRAEPRRAHQVRARPFPLSGQAPACSCLSQCALRVSMGVFHVLPLSTVMELPVQWVEGEGRVAPRLHWPSPPWFPCWDSRCETLRPVLGALTVPLAGALHLNGRVFLKMAPVSGATAPLPCTPGAPAF